MDVKEDVQRLIDEALEDGDQREVARLYGKLREQNPGDEDLCIKEISALNRAYMWELSEERCAHAVVDFPGSLYSAIAQANTAYLRADWQVAADRFTAIRAKFDPSVYKDSLATVFLQIECYENMTLYDEARSLARHFWPLLKTRRFDMNQFGFDLQLYLNEKSHAEHEAWALQGLPESHRSPFKYRLNKAALYRKHMLATAPGVAIVSLGQNCLPWMLPNRWGLRPFGHDSAPVSVFDYFPTINDNVAASINNNFEYFLRESALVSLKKHNKLPFLNNTALSAAFFHETGPWWSEDNWRRLCEAYNTRISNFRKMIRSGQRLYVFCLVGAGNLDVLIQTYIDRLDDDNARLLIINVLKNEAKSSILHPHVDIFNAPYPDDYTWNSWMEFTSSRGVDFESRIAEEMIRQVDLLSQQSPVRKGFLASVLARITA